MEADDRREHLFFLNPKSFPRQADLDRIQSQIRAYFEHSCSSAYSIHVSRYPRDAISVIRKRIAQIDTTVTVRVYAVGGDGILFDCLNGIVGIPNAELAIMPFGGGSDFVRAFGPEHYEQFQDIALQVTAPAVPTDIIHCGNNCALNFCSVGFEAAAVIRTLPLSAYFVKFRHVFPALTSLLYNLGGILTAFETTSFGQWYTVNADGDDISGSYTIINIANGPYYGAGKSVVTTAVPDDGILDMVMVRNVGRLRILALMSDYMHGGYYKYPAMAFLRRVKKISIHSDTPLTVNLDGETFFESDLSIEIIPRGIKIAAVNSLSYRRKVAFHG
jgi:diacylglycerol kinase family enzyme